MRKVLVAKDFSKVLVANDFLDQHVSEQEPLHILVSSKDHLNNLL